MVVIPMSQLFQDLLLPVHEGLNLVQLQSDPTADGVSTLLDEVSPPFVPSIFYAHSRD
jgi:hypothetical protein